MAHSLSVSPASPAVTGPNQPKLDSAEVWQARVDLAACFRVAARHGLEEGICNHFSTMVPGYDDLPCHRDEKRRLLWWEVRMT